jgi:probable DNA repair protein
MTLSGADISTQIKGLSTQVLDYQSLFTRLQAGHTLITGNSRLTRVLTTQYSQWRIKQGDRQWPSPEITSWNLWLEKLWAAASLQGSPGTDRAVPGSRQLISLWESTLSKVPLAHNLLRPETLASQLRDTRNLLIDWQLDLAHPAWFGDENENHVAFYQWNRAFEQRCEKDRWISPEDRTALLIKAISGAGLKLPENFDFLGFDEFNPAQSMLLSALIDVGKTVSCLSITPRQKEAALLKCRDSSDELQQAARWARYWLEKDPGSNVAIVVHNLQERRREVERQLGEILTPANSTASQRAKPWNISMGTPLVRLPMIETAFDLLKLLDRRVDIQDVGRVLRSPWLKGAVTERNSRALLEKRLRDKYPRQLKLGEVEYRSREIKTHDRHNEKRPKQQHEPYAWNSPVLTAILNSLIRFDAEHRGLLPASAWAESFDGLLAGLGWPLADEYENEIAGIDHGENWQALQDWRDALRELASLDTTLPRLDRNTAIKQLKQICRDKIFQPGTPPASVQVLGLYEVNGLRFDHLWVVGLHNNNWPTSASPNPFIPGDLQREAQLPNSSPQRELKVARIITRRLLETAPDCVFSYPAQLDGEDVLPSPLLDIDEINKVSEVTGWNDSDWLGTVAGADKPQIHTLTMPGKLQHGSARGGSSILKHQALCPFRAFASNRLGAEDLETPPDGISPMLHGSLVHEVLENFWKQTKTQAALIQLDEAGIKARVREHVDHVTNENRGLKQRPAFRGVEADRVYRHVLDYLELEKQRESFEVIGFEKEILPEIAGQTIRLIIDRVDRLPSGDEIIIDYKTGNVEPRKWFGDRPEEPQLPLYAISANKAPAAVVFAIIRNDDYQYKGVVKRDGLLPNLPPKATKANQYLVDAGHEMPKTIENWRQILHRLMADFLAGEAAIDPKGDTRTCHKSYCKLQPLCRVGELEQFRKTGQREIPA